MRADWVWWAPGTIDALYGHLKASRGPASLRIMAIRSVCINASCLSPEVFQGVPWTIAQEIWRTLKLK